MAANIASLLDKAKEMHRLSSDYKLALVMGVSHKSLSSYRHGMTLPDARVIAKLCDLTGDDPAVILAEIEEQRATTTEAKALWHQMAVRLQQAAAAGVFSVLAAVALAVGLPSGEARADTLKPQLQIVYIVESNNGTTLTASSQNAQRFTRPRVGRRTLERTPNGRRHHRRLSSAGRRAVHGLGRGPRTE